ncbi:UDP-Glycosyltransferase/glycogen phosphorylase [Fomes fomentarius]|nr:UDP-Glycosyltransferase/glycogen phosphorylase [Fomes fomentarius]
MAFPPTEKHIVCLATQAWGHVRPLIHLSARIVKLRSITVTFVTTNAFYERAKTELTRSFEDEESAKRVRIISSGDVAFLRSDESDQYFETLWKILVEEGEPVCAQSKIRYPSLPKPKAVIIDFFAIKPFYDIKAISGDSVKLYSWVPGLAYCIFYLFGPESLGGKGNIRVKAEEKARLTGKPYDEIAQLTFEPVGEVVRIAGMSPMYDHEYYPQQLQLPGEVGTSIFPRVYETLEKADGLLLFTPTSYEPEAVKSARSWFGETGRQVYAVGPLLPAASKATAQANEKKLSAEATEIIAFLDETLKTSGEKSLVYISFGSVFWPAQAPGNLWAVLDVLIERNHPFILSHAAPFARIPDKIRKKVKAYGKGVLSPWTPQQLILDHPATGWFIAHGGHNGVTEAISAGVPQIIWPFTGDQPLNAVHITDNLQIGYELLEVRTGPGLKPIYRTGYTPKGTIEAIQAEVREVLAKAFGEDGAKKRARLEELRKKVTTEWEDGGSSKRDVSAFLDSL